MRRTWRFLPSLMRISSQKSGTVLRWRTGGLLAAVLYHGHEAGKPETAVLSDFAAALPQEQYRVLRYTFPNQRNCPPVVLAVEKLAEAA